MNFRPIVSAVALAALLLVRPAAAGLPTTPSTTYVPNSTPAIKAHDLNDLQKYLAGLYSALFSIKALDVDGTGGTTAGADPGTVRVSSTISGYSTTAPFALPSSPVGQLSREHVLLGSVRCFITGGSLSNCGGFNVRSVERLALGGYRVTLNTSLPDAFRHVVVVTPQWDTTTPLIANLYSFGIDAGGYQFVVNFLNLAGARVDPKGFNVLVTGG